MFSKTEELNYLTDLLISSSQWQCSENEPLSPLHLEVKDRIRRLTGQQTINVVGIPSNQVEQSVSKPTTESPKDTWTHERVRVRFSDGKQHWAKREHCKKVQRTDRPNLWKWEILPEFEKEYNFNQKEESVCQQ